MQMIKKISEYVKQHHMLSDGDVVITGVSGGADSVCLFLVLVELSREIELSIHVVHINHHIREEAGDDERFVKDLCERYDIPFHVVHADVEMIAKARHITTEEAGREVRYEAFNQYLTEYAGNENGKIAVAHNKNDSAETVLFHLFRGSGIQGLTGILPVRNHIIRPLLCLERSEIEAYLEERGQGYCTDRTNFTDDYARNRIRHHILAYAKEEICQGTVTHIQEAAEKMADIYGFLNRQSQKAYQECVSIKNERACINKNALLKQDQVLHSYIIMQTLGELIGTRKDLSTIHVDSILELMYKQPGRRVSLPYGYCAVREYEGIIIQKTEMLNTSKADSKECLALELKPEKDIWKEVRLNDGRILEYGIFTRACEELIPQKTYTKWFDYDKIKGRLFIRKRMTSDFLVINDKGQRQTIKAYFVNEKIPRELRDSIDLLACDSHILWVIGNRISSYYKVGKDTRLILKINLRGGAQDG